MPSSAGRCWMRSWLTLRVAWCLHGTESRSRRKDSLRCQHRRGSSHRQRTWETDPGLYSVHHLRVRGKPLVLRQWCNCVARRLQAAVSEESQWTTSFLSSWSFRRSTFGYESGWCLCRELEGDWTVRRRRRGEVCVCEKENCQKLVV